MYPYNLEQSRMTRFTTSQMFVIPSGCQFIYTANLLKCKVNKTGFLFSKFVFKFAMVNAIYFNILLKGALITISNV